MKKLIIIFLFFSSCTTSTNIITNNDIEIISTNIKLDLGPGSKGIDYSNLGPSSKGITSLKFNVNFQQDITNSLKIEFIKNDNNKFDINFLSLNKENSFYINSSNLEKGLYKIKVSTENYSKSIDSNYFINIDNNKEIKLDIFNYKDKPELLDIAINSKDI